MLRSFRREVLRSLYWQQRTKFPLISKLSESETVRDLICHCISLLKD